MWETLSKILNVFLGFLSIYFYLESRKLRGFEIDKNLKIKENELHQLEDDHRIASASFDEQAAAHGGFGGSAYYREKGDLEKKHERIILSKKAEIAHQLKLKRYRWIFSK